MRLNVFKLIFVINFWIILFTLFPCLGSAQTSNENKPLFQLTAGLGSEAIYESNVFKTQINEESDLYFTLSPEVTLSSAIWNISIDLDYRPTFYFFTNNFDTDGLTLLGQSLKFASTLYSSNYFDLVVKDTLEEIRADFAEPLTPNNFALQNRLQVQGVFSYDIHSRTFLEFIPHYERIDVQFPGEDSNGYGGEFRFTHELNRMLSAIAADYLQWTNFDNPAIFDSFQNTTEAGFQFNFQDRLRGEIVGLYTYLVLFGGPNSDNFGFKARLDYEMTELTFFDFDFRKIYGRDLTGRVLEQLYMNGGITQHLGPRTRARAEGYYSRFDIPTFSTTDDRVWGGEASLSYEITEQLRARAAFGWDFNIGPTNINNFTAYRGILGLEFDFGAILSSGL